MKYENFLSVITVNSIVTVCLKKIKLVRGFVAPKEDPVKKSGRSFGAFIFRSVRAFQLKTPNRYQ